MPKRWVLLILFCIIINYKEVKCYRVLGVSVSRMKSHEFFFKALMKGLAEDGNNVTFISHFQSTTPTPNLEEIQIDLPIEVEKELGITIHN